VIRASSGQESDARALPEFEIASQHRATNGNGAGRVRRAFQMLGEHKRRRQKHQSSQNRAAGSSSQVIALVRVRVGSAKLQLALVREKYSLAGVDHQPYSVAQRGFVPAEQLASRLPNDSSAGLTPTDPFVWAHKVIDLFP